MPALRYAQQLGYAPGLGYGASRFVGGVSVGDHCEALAYHGFNGIERETLDAIKKWILEGG